MGTAAFAVPSLRALLQAGHRLHLVVTQPDRPGHRLRLTPPPVKVAAQELGLEVFQPERIRAPESVARLTVAAPELIVVVAYGQIVPRSVLEIPPRGVLNVHASLLPRHRGAAPVNHAILAGDRMTGVTIMRLDELLDHGPVLAARETEIGLGEDAVALGGRLALMGAELLVDVLARLDDLRPVEQDHAAATQAPKLSREDGELDWSLAADEIDRRVRALQAWPGVTLPLGGRRVKVLRGRPLTGSGRPGEVLAAGRDGVEVAAGHGSYLLEEVQPPGRRPMAPRGLVTVRA
ncbi:MAG TPA: methionyl-tRNA formyltransferase [Candidatus Dormibacteraeota bacterium]|nr:methionyl-tRNA formyltransferase [Candidatus Dormibacteraeota bacterium]